MDEVIITGIITMIIVVFMAILVIIFENELITILFGITAILSLLIFGIVLIIKMNRL